MVLRQAEALRPIKLRREQSAIAAAASSSTLFYCVSFEVRSLNLDFGLCCLAVLLALFFSTAAIGGS